MCIRSVINKFYGQILTFNVKKTLTCMSKSPYISSMIFDLLIYNPFAWVLYFFLFFIIWGWIDEKKAK